MSRYVEEPGDAARGQRLLHTKGCLRCHASHESGAAIGPDLAALGDTDTPIAWAQAMWNHAPVMEETMRNAGVAWPNFEGREMNDLLAYLRDLAGGSTQETHLLPADPSRGETLFESKGCSACHAIEGPGERLGPEAGPRWKPGTSLIQFAGQMWNHAPGMNRMMQARGVLRPAFDGHEMADLIAFLDTLRCFEPPGSPDVGKRTFAERGCSHCHGPGAAGTLDGPTLRVPGRIFTSLTLASGLWVHGSKMYQRTQQLGLPWPTLSEDEVGDLVAFLSAPR